MAFEEALVARLTGASAVSALVGSRVSFFGRQRADSLPTISLTKVSPGRQWSHDGPDNLDRARVQVDCWALTDTAALALSRAVLGVLEVSATVGSTVLHPAMLDGESFDEELSAEGGARIFRVRQDFMIYHEET